MGVGSSGAGVGCRGVVSIYDEVVVVVVPAPPPAPEGEVGVDSSKFSSGIALIVFT